MGLGVRRVGGHAYHKDGGIDMIAWPIEFEFPFSATGEEWSALMPSILDKAFKGEL
jgi:hypothetical protein